MRHMLSQTGGRLQVSVRGGRFKKKSDKVGSGFCVGEHVC